ncbi:MAG: gliding motility-associated C-terminal domain-containing protein, partial [Labilibaculum antarcticum]
DAAGNSDNCITDVTVEPYTDIEAPTVSCQPATIFLNALGSATLTVADVDDGSTDNVGISSSVLSQTIFSAVGTQSVTLTVSDAAGNSDNCITDVTVEPYPIPKISFSNSSESISEADGTVTIAFSIDQTLLTALNLEYKIEPLTGNATLGSDMDYLNPLNHYVTLPVNATSGTISIQLFDDGIYEGDETFVVKLLEAAEYELGTQKEYEVIIQDNEIEPKVSFASASASIAEDSPSVLKLIVNLSVAYYQDVSVEYAKTESSAIENIHFTLPSDLNVVIPEGATFAEIDIPIIDNAIYEGDVEFLLTLTGAESLGLEVLSSECEITIIDDEVDDMPPSWEDIPDDMEIAIPFLSTCSDANWDEPTAVDQGTNNATVYRTDHTGIANSDCLEKGVYTISYKAVDDNGNETHEISFTIGVIESRIVCASNITATTQIGECDVEVSLPDINYDESFVLVSKTWIMEGELSGSSNATGINTIGRTVFPVGLTTITYELTFADGEVYSCSFMVEILSNIIKPELNIPSELYVCEGEYIELSASCGSNQDVQWISPEKKTYQGELVSIRDVNQSMDGTWRVRTIEMGCYSNDLYFDVSVIPAPNPVFTLGSSSDECVGGKAVLLLYGAEMYNVYANNKLVLRNVIGIEAEIEIESSKLTVEVEGINRLNPCTPFTDPQVLLFKSIPEVTIIEEGGDLFYCPGAAVKISANVNLGTELQESTIYNYYWFIDGQYFREGASVLEFTPLQKDFNVQCEISGSNSCDGVKSNLLNLGERELSEPKINIQLVDPLAVFCLGDEVSIEAMVSDAGENPKFEWYKDIFKQEETGSSYTMVSEELDTWIKCVLISSDDICTDGEPVEASLQIRVEPKPEKPVIEVLGSTQLLKDGNVTLKAPFGSFRYEWSNGAISQSITVSQAGVFKLRLSASLGNCYSEWSDEVEIASIDEFTIVSQPEDSKSLVESVAVFNIEVSGVDVEYQWQQLINGTWRNMYNKNSSELRVETVTESMDGNRYRCFLSNEEGTQLISEEAALLVDYCYDAIVTIQSETGENYFCYGAPLKIMAKVDFERAQSLEQDFSYRWLIDGEEVSGNQAELVITPSQHDFLIRCEVTSNVLCEKIVSNLLKFDAKEYTEPTLDIELLNQSDEICKGEEIIVRAVTENAGANPEFEWYKDIFKQGETGSICTMVPEELDTWIKCVLIPGDDICADGTPIEASLQIKAEQKPEKPVIEVLGSTLISEDESVTLKAPYGSFRYEWSNGATSQSITVLQPGTFRLRLSTSIGNCYSEWSDQVEIVSIDDFAIVRQPSEYKALIGGVAVFDLEVSKAEVEYQWQQLINGTWRDIYKQNNSVLRVEAVTETMGGNLYRCLLSDEEGTQLISEEAELLIGDCYQASVTIQSETGDNYFFYGVPLKIRAIVDLEGAQSSGQDFSYRWLIDGEEVSGNQAELVFIPSQHDLLIRCEVTSNVLCEKVVSNLLKFEAKENPNDLTVSVESDHPHGSCFGEYVTFKTNIGDSNVDVDYQWMVNEIPVGDNSSEFCTNLLSDESVITCRVSSDQNDLSTVGVVSNSYILAVSNKPPKPTISALGSLFLNQGESVNLSTPEGAWEYIWNTNEETNSIEVDEEGFYWVRLKSIDGECFSDLSDSIKVNRFYSITIEDKHLKINSDQSEVLTDLSQDIQESINKSLQESNLYQVEIDSIVDQKIASAIYNMIQGPRWGEAAIDLNGNLIYIPHCLNSKVDSLQYEVSFNEQTFNVKSNSPGNQVSYVDFIENQIQGKVYFDIEKGTDFKLPNAFSPNGDGINDYFIIEGIEIYQDNELVIFNRFSGAVYISKPYLNDWNGTSNNNGVKTSGAQLPDGIYFYILKLDSTKIIKGYIEIKR